METFATVRLEWLRKKALLKFDSGVPDSDTFRRVFEVLDPKELSNSLWNWLNYERKSRCVVGIDGKNERGSGNGDHSAYHVITAFIAELWLLLMCEQRQGQNISHQPEMLVAGKKRDVILHGILSNHQICKPHLVYTVAQIFCLHENEIVPVNPHRKPWD